jgi:hypothetical protein
MYVCVYVCMHVYFECAKRMFRFRSCQHALYNRSCNTSGGCHHPVEAGGHLGECCGQQNQLSKDSDGLDRIHRQPSSRLQGGDLFGMYVCMYVCICGSTDKFEECCSVDEDRDSIKNNNFDICWVSTLLAYVCIFVCMHACIYYKRVTVIYDNIMHSM